MKHINTLTKVTTRLLPLFGLIFGLVSCNADRITKSEAPWGISEPKIKNVFGDELSFTEYRKNPNFKLYIRDQILFSENSKPDFFVQTTCYSGRDERHITFQGKLLKKIKILELLPPSFFTRLKGFHKSTKCLFQFNIENKIGDTHKFSLGPIFIDNSESESGYIRSQELEGFEGFEGFEGIGAISHINVQKNIDTYFEPNLSHIKILCSDFKFLIDKEERVSLVKRIMRKQPKVTLTQFPPKQLCRAIGFREGRIQEITPLFHIQFQWRQIVIKKPKPFYSI